MTTKAVASIQYSDVPGFPAGSAVANIEVTVQNTTTNEAPVTQSVAPGTTSVEFDNLSDGSYTITVEAVDASNSLFGSPVNGSFSISSGGGGGTVTLSLPSAVSASQQ